MKDAFKLVPAIPYQDRAEYERALRDWVHSLSQADAQAHFLYIANHGLSPVEILNEVESGTDLGREFLAGLYALSLRLKATGKRTSIPELIRRSS
jgi:hypothetical protein